MFESNSPQNKGEGSDKAYHKHETVYRNELKFIISYRDYKRLQQSLKILMIADSHSINDLGYMVRSVYFDSLYNNDYYDKLMGIKERKKIRLRTYSIYQENIKLELKSKSDRYQCKEIAEVGRGEASALINGDISVLMNNDCDVSRKIYGIMSDKVYRPVITVEYDREAYIYPMQNIRITFDKNVRASTTDFDIFNPNLNVNPLYDSSKVILEVKYHKLLPDWIRKALSECSTQNESVSKYCMSRDFYYVL